ncbi:MAG TPA: hypothetical protein PLG66_19495, partial [Calditrichia bacterium]|nr:hypothetical protein [Calditrichia bacterium]
MPKTVPDQAPEPPRLSWGKVSLPDNEPGLFSLGHLRLWLKFFDGDLWLCPVQAAETEAEIALPAAPNWQRWTLGKRHGQLEIVPALPDLPLVINPEDPLHLPPGIECQIYVSIPLWVELQIGKNSLLRVPTLQLSKTWFGNFVAGELCYALTTRARRV